MVISIKIISYRLIFDIFSKNLINVSNFQIVQQHQQLFEQMLTQPDEHDEEEDMASFVNVGAGCCCRLHSVQFYDT